MNNRKRYAMAFYTTVAAGILFILLTNPFLIKFYDPWRYHLKSIEEFYNGVSGQGRIWHLMWAKVFKFIGADNIFVWAKIIHIFQFFLAAVTVFYFSKTALTILAATKHYGMPDQDNPSASPFRKGGHGGFDDNNSLQIKFLALFSTILWFMGNGTFSVQYQQAWIMWYSVTYQGLTIPLFWYCLTLTLKIFYESLSVKKITLCIIQIAAASLIIAKIHPMELLYYLINLPLILLVNIKGILSIKNRKVILISLPIIFLILFVAVKYFVGPRPTFLALILSNESIGQVLQKINGLGHGTVMTLNRFPNSFSEVALISLISAVVFRIFYIFRKDRKHILNANLFNYLLISSILFFLIPTVPFLGGVAGYMTDATLVYRFFYMSPWFIFLPFIIYALSCETKANMPFYNVIIVNVLTVLLIIFLSKSFDVTIASKYHYNHTLYKNVGSIINSLDKKKVWER